MQHLSHGLPHAVRLASTAIATSSHNFDERWPKPLHSWHHVVVVTNASRNWCPSKEIEIDHASQILVQDGESLGLPVSFGLLKQHHAGRRHGRRSCTHVCPADCRLVATGTLLTRACQKEAAGDGSWDSKHKPAWVRLVRIKGCPACTSWLILRFQKACYRIANGQRSLVHNYAESRAPSRPVHPSRGPLFASACTKAAEQTRGRTSRYHNT